MSEESKHRELSFVRDYNLKVGNYKEVSGLIKDGLDSWRLCDDNRTYAIESALENKLHGQASPQMIIFIYHCESLVSKDGFFYNKFDCEEYDWVERIYESDYYICRKRDKYGIMNGDGYIVIDIVYPLITRLPQIIDVDIDDIYWYEPPHVREYRKEELGENTKPNLIIKITTYDGEYLLDLTSMHKSKIYDKIYTFGKNYLIESKGLYGLLSRIGEEVVPPKYSKVWPFDKTMTDWSIGEDYRTGAWFQIETEDRKIPIANNGKYYGEVSLEYDECYRVGRDLVNMYFVKRKGKCGMISYNRLFNKYDEIIPIEYDSISFDTHNSLYKLKILERTGKMNSITYAIVQNEKGYQLYDIIASKSATKYYQSLEFSYNNINRNRLWINPRDDFYYPAFFAREEENYALLSPSGIQSTDFIYQSIKSINYGLFSVCMDDQWGVIDAFGKQLVKCEWDEIVSACSNRATVKKDGKQIDIKIEDRREKKYSNNRISTYERQTYDRYNGTYAQDEMGYSDDDIDTIFDGDPSAYWNID